MSEQSAQVLNAVQAAQRIYQTANPSAEQVGRVVQKIESGALPRGPKGGATTTVGGVAEYLARRETARANAHAGGRSSRHAHSRGRAQSAVVHLYRELLTDYFLAVFLRRRTKDRSYLFGWTVIGTQAVLLAAALYIVVALVVVPLRHRAVPPQEIAAQAWLENQFHDVQIESIEVQKDPSMVQAVFSYRVNNRRIHSSLRLTLQEDKIVSVDSGQ